MQKKMLYVMTRVNACMGTRLNIDQYGIHYRYGSHDRKAGFANNPKKKVHHQFEAVLGTSMI